MAGIRREAENAGWPLDAALAECVSRGWQGFKADWVRDAKPPQIPTEANGERQAPVARAEDEWRALMGDDEFERRRDKLLIADDERKVVG